MRSVLCSIFGQLDFYMFSILLVCVYIYHSIFFSVNNGHLLRIVLLLGGSFDVDSLVVSLHRGRRAELVGLGLQELHTVLMNDGCYRHRDSNSQGSFLYNVTHSMLAEYLFVKPITIYFPNITHHLEHTTHQLSLS